MKSERIKITPKWSQSKEEVWAKGFADLEDTPKVVQLYKRKLFIYALAAAVALLLILPATAYLYTKELNAARGEQLSAILPDGSTVELNAESSVSYKPLWWNVSRSVEFTGEAYFEVAKGKTFSVASTHGKVEVLGTSFNVFDRSEGYSVTCLTGKVNVKVQKQSTILSPNMQANYKDGMLTATAIENASQSIGWKDGYFSFTAEPLARVIAEVERQYNLKIKSPQNIDYLYTGHFSKSKNIEHVLQIIGQPFGIRFEVEK